MATEPETPSPDVMEVAESIVSSANVTTCDGYYEVDIDAAATVIAEAKARWEREAGEAKGKLEASEMAGVVEGWKAKCEALERRCERLREALRDGKQSLEVAIYGLPEMLDRNALSDDENMVGQLQCAVERMNTVLKGHER